MARITSWRWLLLALAAIFFAPHGCAHDGSRRGDYDDDLDNDSDADDPPRRRHRRRRRRRAKVLISARRLPDAIVERSSTGRARSDLARLRDTMCDGRVGDKVIFYQLIVSRHWHYYWLCSSTKAMRAQTQVGARKLSAWLRRVRRRAQNGSGDCSAGSAAKFMSQRHESGILVKGYCDGILILRYPDRGKTTISFRTGSSDLRKVSGGSCPRAQTCPRCPAQQRCPAQKRCPEKHCPTCPRPNTKVTCKVYGEKAFWLGVRQACRRICPAIYKRCRKIDPKTAMCSRLSDYCAAMKGVCKR